jgi:hypothetical protein
LAVETRGVGEHAMGGGDVEIRSEKLEHLTNVHDEVIWLERHWNPCAVPPLHLEPADLILHKERESPAVLMSSDAQAVSLRLQPIEGLALRRVPGDLGPRVRSVAARASEERREPRSVLCEAFCDELDQLLGELLTRFPVGEIGGFEMGKDRCGGELVWPVERQISGVARRRVRDDGLDLRAKVDLLWKACELLQHKGSMVFLMFSHLCCLLGPVSFPGESPRSHENDVILPCGSCPSPLS